MDIKNDAKKMVEEFNSKDLPYKLEIVPSKEDNEEYIVAKWKWMDATYFNGIKVTNEIKEFVTYVKLRKDGTYTWFDSKNESESSIGITGTNISSNVFYGKSWEYKKVIVLGKDNQINKSGLVSFELKTSSIHKPIEEWLNNNGYKKRTMSFSEQKKEIISSMDPKLMTTIGIMSIIAGATFIISAIYILASYKSGPMIGTINGVEKVLDSSDIVTFLALFGGIGIIVLTFGILFLKLFIPKLKK